LVAAVEANMVERRGCHRVKPHAPPTHPCASRLQIAAADPVSPTPAMASLRDTDIRAGPNSDTAARRYGC
jgi:hypothetical protein